MQQPDTLASLAAQVGAALTARGRKLTVAESCTGGWIAKLLTDIPGSSAWFDRGFVTYSNAAKEEMLAVRPATLAAHGAVSEAIVLEMAAGALAASHADVALAVTGIAGPDGGTPDKPVGTVWLAWALAATAPEAELQHFSGDREAVRAAAVAAALQGLLARLEAA